MVGRKQYQQRQIAALLLTVFHNDDSVEVEPLRAQHVAHDTLAVGSVEAVYCPSAVTPVADGLQMECRVRLAKTSFPDNSS